VEPRSVLEELGFLQSGFAQVVIPRMDAEGIVDLDYRACSTPTGSFSSGEPRVGSPRFSLVPGPLPRAQGPVGSDSVAEEVPLLPISQLVLPEPATPPSIAPPPLTRNWSMMANADAREAANDALHTPNSMQDVRLRRPVSPPAPVSPLQAGSFMSTCEQLSSQDVRLRCPESPPAPVFPLQALVLSRPEAAAQQAAGSKKHCPWSPRPRSPYRGGVLSLFTPSPASPPRRVVHDEPVVEAEDLKDMDEDAQIAAAVAASLGECAPSTASLREVVASLKEATPSAQTPDPPIDIEAADPPRKCEAKSTSEKVADLPRNAEAAPTSKKAADPPRKAEAAPTSRKAADPPRKADAASTPQKPKESPRSAVPRRILSAARPWRGNRQKKPIVEVHTL